MSIAEKIALLSLTIVAMVVIMEGLASFLLSFRDRGRVLWAAGQKRSSYDPDLGWANRPNIHIPDLYGPGRYLRTNSQGFRNDRDFDQAVPDGRLRVICSGDSFTFGEGVANDRCWCQQLSNLEPRFEMVNLGQTGYGIDQAYLWYKRDGLKLSHQLHLLEFITDDFYRMQTAVFAGYAKPVLDVVEGRLVVTNVPVPRRSYYVTWLDRQIRNLNRFRTVEFLTRFLRKVRGTPAEESETDREARNRKTREILRKIFEDLKNLRDERSIQPVLVYLPTLHELMGDGEVARDWTRFLTRESNVFGIPLLDVMGDFRQLPAHEVVGMYIPEGRSGPNHFNEQGNAYVAQAIYKKLMSHPSIVDRLVPSDQRRAVGDIAYSV